MLSKNNDGKDIAYHAFNSPHELYIGYGDSLATALKAVARRVKVLDAKGEYSYHLTLSTPTGDFPGYTVNLFAEYLGG